MTKVEFVFTIFNKIIICHDLAIDFAKVDLPEPGTPLTMYNFFSILFLFYHESESVKSKST
jgi:hypothetical protein